MGHPRGERQSGREPAAGGPTAGEPVYTFDTIVRDDDGRIQFHYVIVDLTAEYVGGELRAGDDAERVRWVEAVDLSKLNVSPPTLALLQGRFRFGI